MYSPLNRITINPEVCSGEPCIRGTSVPVSAILDLLARGMSTDQIIDVHPQLTLPDVQAIVSYRKSIVYGLQLVRGKH